LIRATAPGLRVLALTTLQQAGLTSVRFGLPILAPFWRDALHLSLARVGLLLAAFDLGALVLFVPIGLLTDRWGEPVVLTAGALFTAGMTAVITQAGSFWSLAVLLAISGSWSAASSWSRTRLVSGTSAVGIRPKRSAAAPDTAIEAPLEAQN